ncbi:MAG: type II secretion system protein GspJ [Gammaproteobacteria bacterium RIFCSPHIGHO2_12_FULL_37_34]|nr:MAG: type II secretion system protein GspJ [Gammaproteobacteria bacterium RIFCSPHIGHO2_12_FULL_37_34]
MERNKLHGFTLLEILVALFIFTILSIMLVGGLHSVINAQSVTLQHGERLHQLQLALLMMSRDIEQTINRPVIISSGREEQAFVGNNRMFTFTHLGLAHPTEWIARSTMQRTRYSFNDNAIWRTTWPVVDQAPQSRSHSRRLLVATQASFQYLDKKGRFHNDWPVVGQHNESLPRAIRIYLTLPKWGELSQLYVIPQ